MNAPSWQPEWSRRVIMIAVSLGLATWVSGHRSAVAADIVKANNTNSLNLGTSWASGTAPGTGDIGVWDSTVTATTSVALGGNLTWGGIRLGSGVNAPGGDVTITGANTIDLSSTLSALDVGDTRSITFSNTVSNAVRFASLRGSTMVTINNANSMSNSAFGSAALNFTGTLLLRGGSATIADGSSLNYFFFDASANDFQVAGTRFALDTGASTTDRKDFGLGDGFATGGRSLVVSSLQGYGAIRVDQGATAGARTIVVDQASTTTFDGAVLSHRSGGGVQRAVTLEKRGSGSLTLAGFVGKETAGASAGAVAVNLVANGGLLNVTNPLNTTTATIGARYSGTVTVTSGTLAFSSQAILDNAGTVGATAIQMNGGTLRWNNGTMQDISAGGRLTLVAGKTAVFDTNGNDVTLATALAGGAIAAGLTKTGGGSLTLAAVNTYAGTTTVSAGTLALSGSGSIGTGGLDLGTTASPGVFDLAALVSGTYVLPATGDLTGVGTLAGDGKTLAVRGSFLPGNSPGTVTVGTGFALDLSQSGTSTFEITSPLYTPGTFDLVNGAGSVVFGGILSLRFSGGAYANGTDALQVFTNTGGRFGDFTSVVATGLGAGQYATFNPVTGSIMVVPEPSTYAMALAGLACGGLSLWRRRKRFCFHLFAAVAVLGLGSAGVVHAQSTTWDSMLSNSSWYVPEENLLAYMTSGTSFTDPPPSAGSDQTLWSLGTATNGTFTGTAVGTFRPLSLPLLAITNTDSIVSGIVTDAGQIRMTFQGVTSGEKTIGIGQVRTISGTDYMEMQMITGGSSVLTTHWAYMAKYDPNTFTPPTLFPDGTLLSQEWRWTDGSTWRLQSDDLFGPGGSGTFTITNYRNGYFWGPGTGPTGTEAATYTQIGSFTPEGNVLFNVLIGGTLTSLAGQITGTGLTAQMALRSYDGTSFGPFGYASVISVPEPATAWMALAGLACGGYSMWRRRKRA